MKFHSFYVNRPKPVSTVLDTETKFVDQSEADRAGLKFQLERYGFDSLQQQLQKTQSQFGYADTRYCASFAELVQKNAEATSYFMQLPAKLRAKFDHSPIKFFSEIEQNPEQMFKDGYISKSLAKDLGVASAQDTLQPSEGLNPPPDAGINPPKTDVVESVPQVSESA